jgi:transposase
MVADSALYTAPNIEQMATLRWLCRVPLTLKTCKATDRATQRQRLR